MKTLLLLIPAFLLFSCSLQYGYVQFKGNENEIIATNMIKEFMKKNPNPSIVLKVPLSEEKATQSDWNSYIYNTIEKELLVNGFTVRDRGLFNEVVSKSQGVNYAELKELTGTDLILELVQFSNSKKISTNQYYGRKGDIKKTNMDLDFYSAVIEFKLTLVETNEYAGSYTFYYTPCEKKTDDCECRIAYKRGRIYSNHSLCNNYKNKNKEDAMQVPKDAMIEFVKSGVKVFLSEIKNS